MQIYVKKDIFRFTPQDSTGLAVEEWDVHGELVATKTLLRPIKNANPGISYADLIVLAATMALDKAGATGLKDDFCSGRVDDDQNRGWDEFLEPRIVGEASEDILKFRVHPH